MNTVDVRAIIARERHSLPEVWRVQVGRSAS